MSTLANLLYMNCYVAISVSTSFRVQADFSTSQMAESIIAQTRFVASDRNVYH